MQSAFRFSFLERVKNMVILNKNIGADAENL